MSILDELLKLMAESRNSKKEKEEEPNEILLSADNKEFIVEVLRKISATKKIAKIVEGSQNFFDPPDSYRKDSAKPPNTMTHIHVYRRGKEMAVVNMNGTGHDGYSGTKVYRRQGDFLRSKGVNLPMNNRIAGSLNENFPTRFFVILSEAELLALLWERD